MGKIQTLSKLEADFSIGQRLFDLYFRIHHNLPGKRVEWNDPVFVLSREEGN